MELVAVIARKELAGNELGKSIWIGVSIVLSVALLGVSVEYLSTARQLVIFCFCIGQIGSLVLLCVTLKRIKDLIREKESMV